MGDSSSSFEHSFKHDSHHRSSHSSSHKSSDGVGWKIYLGVWGACWAIGLVLLMLTITKTSEICSSLPTLCERAKGSRLQAIIFFALSWGFGPFGLLNGIPYLNVRTMAKLIR